MAASPLGFGHLLGALDFHLARAKQIAVSADPASESASRLAGAVWERYLPNRVLAVGRSEGSPVPLLRNRPQQDGAATAYVCEGFVCLFPVTTPEELRSQLLG
jgi:hypothetical protein